MNSVNLVGHLTAKPAMKITSSNKAVTRFTVAISRHRAEGADFINCVAWGKTAENIQKYLDKGSLVSVTGRVQTGSYTNSQGRKIYTMDIVAESVQFLNTKKSGQDTQKQENVVEQVEQDPFAEFGEQVSIDDNFLD